MVDESTCGAVVSVDGEVLHLHVVHTNSCSPVCEVV